MLSMDWIDWIVQTFMTSGKMLSSLQFPGDVSSASAASQMKRGSDVEGGEAHEEADSSNRLGGYHGSIHTQDQGGQVIYYSVAVYSEKLADGTNNGIVAFDSPWKNVVGTLYHELNEARTDPDVEDANKNLNNGLIGWTSNDGEVHYGSEPRLVKGVHRGSTNQRK